MIYLLRRDRSLSTGRDMAVAMTKQAEEKGAARINLIQTDIQGSATFSLFFRHAPPEVHVN